MEIKKKEKRYLCNLEAQKELISEICFGKCKKAYFSWFSDGELNYICCPEKDCEYCQDSVENFCYDDDHVYDLRKLMRKSTGYCVKKERDIEEVRCRFCKDFKHFKKIRDG